MAHTYYIICMSHSDFIEDYYEAYYNQHELEPDADLEECQDEYKNVFNEWLVLGGGNNDIQSDFRYYNDICELYDEVYELNKSININNINVCLYYHKYGLDDNISVDWWISLSLPKQKKYLLGLEIWDSLRYIYLEAEVNKNSVELIESRNTYSNYNSLAEVEALLNPVIRKEIINKCLLEV